MRVFYASLEQRSDFRRKAAEALLCGARERLRQHGKAMDTGALEELHVWVRHASTIAARGSVHDEEAARHWLLVQQEHHPEHADAARAAALRVRGMPPGRLDMLGARRAPGT